MQVEFGQPLQSSDVLQAGSSGRSQLNSTTLRTPEDNTSELMFPRSALHQLLILNGDDGLSGRVLALLLESQLSSFLAGNPWSTNFCVLGVMLITLKASFGSMKLTWPVKVLQLKWKYMGSPQSGPVLRG